MIRHIVMFKLKEFATPADKQAKMQEIKTGLEALIDKIDVLRMIRVDFNEPAETWISSLLRSWIHLRMSERMPTIPNM